MKTVMTGLFALAVAFPVAAQFPDRPVTMLNGYPAGGNVDIVSRLLVEGMRSKFPKGLVIVYKPGAAGAVAVTELIRSQPDGYTIILTPHSALVIAAQVQDLAYKTPDDYDPFANVVSYYPMLAVRAESPYKTLKDLVAAAKGDPGKISVGSPGEGTSSHLNPARSMSPGRIVARIQGAHRDPAAHRHAQEIALAFSVIGARGRRASPGAITKVNSRR